MEDDEAIIQSWMKPLPHPSMGITKIGQICIMYNSYRIEGVGTSSGHRCLRKMDMAMARDGIKLNDRQLSCARIQSTEGQNYLAAMSVAVLQILANKPH